MTCKKCGATVKDDHTFCNQCGEILSAENVQPDSENKEKTKVPFYISWPFIIAMSLITIAFPVSAIAIVILTILRTLFNKKNPQNNLPKIRNILIGIWYVFYAIILIAAISASADSAKQDKIYDAIEGKDYVAAAEMMSEYIGNNPRYSTDCDIFYTYYTALEDYEKAADTYISFYEKHPDYGNEASLENVDKIADKLSKDTLDRLSAVKKLIAETNTTTKAETTKAEEKTTKQTEEKTTKTQSEKTTTKKQTEPAKPTSSEKKKIDKHIEKSKYEDLAELYPKLSDGGKQYLVSCVESSLYSLFGKDSYYRDDITAIKAITDCLKNASISSSGIDTITHVVDVTDGYYTELHSLPLKYSGPIPAGKENEYLDVYLDSRIQLDGEKRYYVAYTRYEYFQPVGYYPDRDSEIVIIRSETPLSEGVNQLYAVQNGTYDTITNDGFENTHKLYIIYTDAQWEEYYQSEDTAAERNKLNSAIDDIELLVFPLLKDGKTADAETQLNKLIKNFRLYDFCGSWGDEYSMRCYMDISTDGDTFDIEISWSSGASYTTVWTYNGIYDIESDSIICKNGTRTEIDSSGYTEKKTVKYTDGNGKISFSGDKLLWKDNKENAGKDCIFAQH